jgi:hypothetical protein
MINEDSEEELPTEEDETDIDAQLKHVSDQITAREEARNHIEFKKLGEHINVLFDALSKLST